MLGGLSREDVGRLIELTSGVPRRPALVDAVHATTEGNPFFAREVLALLLAEGRLDDPPDELPLPDGVRETIRRRLEPLDERPVRDARARRDHRAHVSTSRRSSAPRRWIATACSTRSTRPPRSASSSPCPAASATTASATCSIRDTLFTGMPIAVRLTGHRAVGEALEHVYRGAIEEHLPEIAHHFLCAAPRGDPAKAVDYAERAAHRALDTLAYEQAVDLFERALAALERMDADVPRRAGLLLGLGTAQSRAGRADRAGDVRGRGRGRARDRGRRRSSRAPRSASRRSR